MPAPPLLGLPGVEMEWGFFPFMTQVSLVRMEGEEPPSPGPPLDPNPQPGWGGGVPEPGPELIRTRHGSKASRVSLHTASQQRAVLSRQVP